MPSKIRKRGNSYQLAVVYDGKTFTKTVPCTTKADAEKAWTAFANDVYKEHIVAKTEGNMTLDDFYMYWKQNYAETNLEKTTQILLDNIFYRISSFLGHIRLSSLRPRHIVEFSRKLTEPSASVEDKPLSAAYIKKHLTTLKSILSCAQEWGFISTNPAENIKTPKSKATKKEMPTEEELATFLAAIDEHPILKHRLLVSLAFGLGLRREEIFGLQWGDIDLDNKTLSVCRAVVYVRGEGIIVKDTKTDSGARKIPVPESIITLLHQWRDKIVADNRKKDTPLLAPIRSKTFVFAQPDGSAGHPHSFNSFLRRFCQKIEIPLISPHDLRHMYGSYLLAGGVNIATISALMGHTDKSFTMSTYIHEIESMERHTADIMDIAMKKLQKNKKSMV